MAPKAGAPKKKKAKPKLSDKDQSERFIETARQLGFENDSSRFEEVFKKIAPPKVRRGGLSEK
jgi:hypothetical protein